MDSINEKLFGLVNSEIEEQNFNHSHFLFETHKSFNNFNYVYDDLREIWENVQNTLCQDKDYETRE